MDVRRAVAALLLLGLLGGCSDDGSSSDPPEPTTSASTSPSPSEPVLPEEAQGSDEASAKAFVRYWFEVLSYSLNSGSSTRLMSLSTSDCISCGALRKNIREAYEEGGRVDADGWRPISIRRLSNYSPPAFQLQVVQGEEEYLNASGVMVRHFSGGQRDMTIQLIHQGSTWRVKQLDIKR